MPTLQGSSSHVSWLPSEKVMVQQSEQDWSQSLCDLILGMAPLHFCCILFLRSKSPEPGQTQKTASHKGINTRRQSPWEPSQGLPPTATLPCPIQADWFLHHPTSTFHPFLPLCLHSELTLFLCLILSPSQSQTITQDELKFHVFHKIALITLHYSWLLHVL